MIWMTTPRTQIFKLGLTPFITGLALTLTTIGSGAQAAPYPAFAKLPAFTQDAEIQFPSDGWVSPADFKKMTAKMSVEKSRKLASAPSEAQMSAKYREFIDKVLALKTTAELDALLMAADTNYASYPADLQFMVAQLIPLRAYRGYIYRLRPLVTKARVTDSLLVTSAKGIMGGLTALMPQQHNQLILDYITQPFGDDVATFQTEKQMQGHSRAMIYPAVATAALRLKNLNLDGQTVLWDNRVVFGRASFPDNVDDRFRVIGEAERLSALSAAHANLYSLAFSSSYDLTGLMKIQKGFSELVGFDSMVGEIDGLSAKKRVKLINDQVNYLKRTCDNPPPDKDPKCMRLAFAHLHASVNAANSVFEITGKSPDDTWRLMDPATFRPFERMNRLALSLQQELVNEGEADVRSNVDGGGSVARVNLRKFFDKPPISLKVFLPTGFDESPEYFSRVVKGQKIVYRNFRAGRAIAWNEEEFARYIKGGTTEQNSRLLNQAWGGWLVGAPILMAY